MFDFCVIPFDRLRVSRGDPLGETREGIACVTSLDRRTARNSQPTIRVTLRNRDCVVAGVVRSGEAEDWQYVKVGDPVWVSGTVEPGERNDAARQLCISSVRLLSSQHPVRPEMNPASPVPRTELYARFLEIDLYLSPPASHLVEAVFDLVGWSRFFTAPAAVAGAHAYTGGLAEHALEVASVGIMLRNLGGYSSDLNLDAVVAGALLHDIGQVEEIRWDGELISARPRLSSHVARGQVLVTTAYERNREHFNAVGLRPEFVETICHIVESHHTTRRSGSPTEPSCPEAVVVAAADFFSAGLKQMVDALDAAPEFRDGWAERSSDVSKPVFSLVRLLSAMPNPASKAPLGPTPEVM